MTGPLGNKGSRGNKTHCFLQDQPRSGLVIHVPPNSQIEKKLQRNCLLDVSWVINLLRFQGKPPDHVRVESSSHCFPRKIVSFDSRHVNNTFFSNRKTYLNWGITKHFIYMSTEEFSAVVCGHLTFMLFR